MALEALVAGVNRYNKLRVADCDLDFGKLDRKAIFSTDLPPKQAMNKKIPGRCVVFFAMVL